MGSEMCIRDRTYGALQLKLKDAGETTKAIEDIVGSVRGFLKAQ